MENYFLIHRWTPEESLLAFSTNSELRTLHCTFGHPFMTTLDMLLGGAGGPNFDVKITKSLEKIKKYSKICTKLTSSCQRFKLSVGLEELRFNRQVQADTMFKDERPVIHIFDVVTHFCAASYPLERYTMKLEKIIQNMWSLMSLDLTEYLVLDQGSAYTSTKLRGIVESVGPCLDEAPIGTTGAISVVDRYYAP